MTREIKFRAWNLKSMMYSDTYHTLSIFFQKLETIEFADGNFKLMQYTGLKDKNGKEIYEGDVLKHDRYSTEFKEDDVKQVRVKSLQQFFEDRGLYTREYGEDWDAENFEIMGNIYENPELIK